MKRSDIWLGIGLIFLGLGFGGDAAGFWEVGTFLEAWWVLFVIAPCVINLYECGIHRGNMIGLGLGMALLLVQWFPSFRDFVVAYVFVVMGCVVLWIPSGEEIDEN